MNDRPDFIFASQWMWDLFWEGFARGGQRHRLVAHWIKDLGWKIEPHVYANFVAQDPPNGL